MPGAGDHAAASHGSTILVVDDEPPLVALVGMMLSRAGYQVLEASDGDEALRISAEHPEPIRLLLTDILMPEMNGYELAEHLKTARPEAKVLYMSGYTDQILLRSTGRSLGEAALLRKPFTQHKLITRVAELLA
jgi:two-component system, cell cycle sensor histidine kinase and response regulator CckA